MVEWLYFILLGFSLSVGACVVALGCFGVRPRGWLVILLLAVELGLLVQLAVSVGVVVAGQRAVVSTIEFFGYLLVVLLIPPGGVIWALTEPTRWSTVVLGFSSLIVSIMLVRMNQIWTGIPIGG